MAVDWSLKSTLRRSSSKYVISFKINGRRSINYINVYSMKQMAEAVMGLLDEDAEIVNIVSDRLLRSVSW